MLSKWATCAVLSVICSILVCAYKSFGCGSSTVFPIIKIVLIITGVLCVDNTDLYIFNDVIKILNRNWPVVSGFLRGLGENIPKAIDT